MILKICYYTQFHDPTLTDAKVSVMTQVRKQILLLLLLIAGNQKYVVRVPFSGVTFMLTFMNNGQKV